MLFFASIAAWICYVCFIDLSLCVADIWLCKQMLSCLRSPTPSTVDVIHSDLKDQQSTTSVVQKPSRPNLTIETNATTFNVESVKTGTASGNVDQSTSKTPTTFNLATLSMSPPRLYRVVCTSRLFFMWQLVYRHLCPLIVASLQFALQTLLTHFLNRHVQLSHGVNLELIQKQRNQRNIERKSNNQFSRMIN